MVIKKYVGSFIDTPKLGVVRILHNHHLIVSEEGFVHSFSPDGQGLAETRSDEIEVIRIPPGSFMLPSFCDLHLHAPQFLYQGTGLHLPLMEWLDQYAFRAEERIDADPELARRTYSALARRLKEHGTGAVLLFGTIKEKTNLILAEVMQSAGIRAFVGKLSMDISSRDTYKEASTQDALDAAESFTKNARSSIAHLPPQERLVEPVLTPRFVPTCSDELLSGLGALSARENVRVQSHLAEARDQVDWVQRERGIPDIDVFDKHSLLTPRTIQAHCTFLCVPDLTRMATRGAGIVHCPLSNAYFSAVPFALREALAAGAHVGLGTDVAGGYSIDPMNAMRNAVLVSRMREGARREAVRQPGGEAPQGAGDVSVNWKEALYLATRGGAATLGLPEGAGSFEVGAPFDAQLIRLYDDHTAEGVGPLDFFDAPDPKEPITEEMLEKWWCIGDTRNREGLWIQGRQIFERI
ncbi:hypothetical protein M0805_003182 [Coniferiporia weirii]|nr:hypothetical protein M0805_003182 [Coniferiporia weirii]